AFRPGWYVEGELQPTSRWRVIPGVRLDYARDSGHADLAPRIVTRYDIVKGNDDPEHPVRRTTLKGGAGLFYMPPQFQEPAPVFGTPGLKSTRTYHYSVGVEQEITRHVELSVEGFYKDIQRAVGRAPTPDGGYVYNNLANGSVIGLETLLKYKPDSRFF